MKKIFMAAVLTAMVAVSGVWAEPNPDETKSIGKYGQVGLWNTLSAQTLGYGRLSLNIYYNHAMDKDFIKNAYMWESYSTGSPDNKQRRSVLLYDSETKIPNYKRETLNLSIAYGMARFLDLGVMAPIYIDNIGEGVTFPKYGGDKSYADLTGSSGDDAFTKMAIGDVEISLKFQYPPYPHRKFFEMAYYGAISIPTGAEGYGIFPRHRYYQDKRGDDEFLHYTTENSNSFQSNAGVYEFYTSRSPEVDMKMLWTWDFREMTDNFPVLFHVNYGLRWTLQYVNEHVFYLNSALEVRPAEWLSIFADFSAEPRFGSIQQEETFYVYRPDESGSVVLDYEKNKWKRGLLDDPMRISPGIAILTPVGITASAGVDISLARKEGFYYGDRVTQDGWENTILWETGVEPKVAFAASLGWNGLTVKRQTVVPDAPIIAPEPQIDTIRIVDTVYVDKIITDTVRVEVEKAPKAKPTYTITASVAAGQGQITPVGMNVVKEGDLAVYVFTPAQGFSIENVSINGQNMGAMPQYTFASVKGNQVITVSFKEDPKPVVVEVAPAPAPVAIEIPREGLVLRGVNFQTGKAILTPSSYDALDAVIKSLREWPEVKLEIQGHTDNVGKRDANMKLSKARAESVMKYFIDAGVPSERLKAIGYGPDVPVSDNDTPAGKELNRRVELKRID